MHQRALTQNFVRRVRVFQEGGAEPRKIEAADRLCRRPAWLLFQSSGHASSPEHDPSGLTQGIMRSRYPGGPEHCPESALCSFQRTFFRIEMPSETRPA